MTFHFAHLAPPGADLVPTLAAAWDRYPLIHRLVVHRGRAPIPAQPDPLPAALPLTEPRVA
jgi:hypothetical protein